ncbi:MAG: hypothetical protein K2W85_15850 [Phycisphaerales bacterium]|nr:hypothetical protein [Phycisphaerales bacterium]
MTVSPLRSTLAVMEHIEVTADDRTRGWCVYCGGADETLDHVPSRVFLDSPHPANPPTVPACWACNNSFSIDEAYVAALVECALRGSVAAACCRAKVGQLLQHAPALAARLASARYDRDGNIGFTPEADRVSTIIVKLARGHAAYEQSEPQLDAPTSVVYMPFTAMSSPERSAFETSREVGLQGWPEVGSRAFNRAVLAFGEQPPPDVGPDCWIVVQPGNYRYRVEFGGGCRVQIVLREYLAAEVVWNCFPDGQGQS